MSQQPADPHPKLPPRKPTRQIIPGHQLRPPTQTSAVYAAQRDLLTSSQRTYLVSVGVLLFLGLLLLAVFSMGVASIIFALLSLTLISGWLVF